MAKGTRILTIVLAILATPALAQNPDPPGTTDDILSRPTEYGLRTTPGLARMIARLLTNNVFARQYKMDKAKTEDATEMVARRIMQAAHALDGPGSQEFAERYIEELVEYQMGKGQGRGGLIPPGFGKEFAEKLVPMLPTIRETIRNIGQDIRPMLPITQQLKLARDLMGVNTAFDAFQDRMTKWASGEEQPSENPFRPKKEPAAEAKVKLDEKGQSDALKQARAAAQGVVDKGRLSRWEKYVKDAKTFYKFDDSQTATANSILREYLERAKTITKNEGWRTRAYQNQLWMQMILKRPESHRHPLHTLLKCEFAEIVEPLDALGNELKQRIETIPTTAQKQAAQVRLDQWLAEKGLDLGSKTKEAP